MKYDVRDCGFTSPCWVWTGPVNDKGYARRNSLPAHRWYYRELVGPIPAGHDLDHLCRNRRCVNPEHLEPVTHAENCRRARRHKSEVEGSPLAKLRVTAGLTQAELAAHAGVAGGTISDWERGRSPVPVERRLAIRRALVIGTKAA